MKLVFGSSPLRGNITENVEFAKRCAKFIIRSGNSPCMPHLFFPCFLDDNAEADRKAGISCGLKWLEKSDEAWFFTDSEETCSDGMKIELAEAKLNGIPIKFINPSIVNSISG